LLLAGLCAIAAACLLHTSSATAASSAPAWKLTATSQPTNFAPSASGGGGRGSYYRVPQYSIVATNVGPATTSGPVTLTLTLPAGLTPVEPEGFVFRFPHIVESGERSEYPCTIAAQAVACTDPFPVEPGQWLQVVVGVEVAPTAAGPLTAVASVAGGGASATASTTTTSLVGAAPPSFDFISGSAGLSAAATGSEGKPAVQAGSYPYQLTVDSGFPTESEKIDGNIAEAVFSSVGHLRRLEVVLPRGVIVNPNATTVRCTEAQLEAKGCPDASQVGTVAVMTETTRFPVNARALYNMVPPPGAPAEFGFEALEASGIYVHLLGGVRTGGDYALFSATDNILARELNPILSVQAQLWGDPSSPVHDGMRGFCLEHGGSCAVPRTTRPFLTMPSACSAALSVGAVASSWEDPSHPVGRSTILEGPGGEAVGVNGCGRLPFRPTIAVQPEVNSAETPTGLHVDLHVPQTEGLNTLATANLEDAKVTLPAGLAVSPSAANGLGACTEAQVELHGPNPARCPDDAKIGSVEVDTPLLDHPLPGAVYVAKPHENPFGSLLAIYIAVDDPQTGVVIKLAGHVEADPVTGQLTTTFDENPELPFEDFKLDFFGGPRAALSAPSACGAYRSEGEFAPWSGSPPVQTDDSFTISRGANGSPCASGEAAEPNAPSFEAGTETPLAGSYSPFVLHLHREDGTQHLKALNLALPPGLTGKLAGVPYCPGSALAVAETRSGRDEQATPSCPAASEVGTVTVGAGPGSTPYHVQGHAYLAGPYKGAPLSLAIITPAVAGPYDLGTVVVRSALYVDPETAQITARSDPIPTILQGIPLDVRSISVTIGRPDFTLNPTSCEAMTVSGEAVSTTGNAAALRNRFQVGGCKGLDFKPNLKIHLKGATKRVGHPALRAVLTAESGEANIGRAQVNLPHGEFLDQGNLNKTCTKPVLLAGNCPASSVYGHARAWTPLLGEPLHGPVYLVGGYGYKLPALVAELNGQIRILLVGKVDSGKNKGIRTTFETVPDAPVSRFVLEMKGGKKYGLLENSENLCKAKKAERRAIVGFTGHNGNVDHYRPVVTNQCRKKHRKSWRAHRPARGHKRHTRIFQRDHH
jgi:hypothetical protein